MSATPGALLDYAEIVDADSLQPVVQLTGPAPAALAVKFGATRLIDNIELMIPMSHPLFGPEVRLMLQEGDAAEMRTFCETLHPATVAEALADEAIEDDDIWRVLQTTSIREQADVFEYFPIEWQVQMVEGTGRPHMARLIEKMSHDDRVDCCCRAAAARRRSICCGWWTRPTAATSPRWSQVPGEHRRRADDDRLRLAAANITRRRGDRPAAPAGARTRETIYYVYVLDEPRASCWASSSLRDLILAAAAGAGPRTAWKTNCVTVACGRRPREGRPRRLARYDLLAMPVVDDEGRLVGIVTHDDVIDVVVEEATEDVHRMGGRRADGRELPEAPFVTVWRKRPFGWRACSSRSCSRSPPCRTSRTRSASWWS